MVKEDILEKVKCDFAFLKERKDVLGVLVFGSLASGEFHDRSDIDICIVAPETKDLDDLIDFVFKNIYNRRYDIKFFELLPLRIKIEVIKNHKVIYSRNLADLYEYFYFYRKLWKDQERRNTLRPEEIKEFLSQ